MQYHRVGWKMRLRWWLIDFLLEPRVFGFSIIRTKKVEEMCEKIFSLSLKADAYERIMRTVCETNPNETKHAAILRKIYASETLWGNPVVSPTSQKEESKPLPLDSYHFSHREIE